MCILSHHILFRMNVNVQCLESVLTLFRHTPHSCYFVLLFFTSTNKSYKSQNLTLALEQSEALKTTILYQQPALNLRPALLLR